jgi:hypothetical protein
MPQSKDAIVDIGALPLYLPTSHIQQKHRFRLEYCSELLTAHL